MYWPNLKFVALPVPELIAIGVLGGVRFRDIAAFVLQNAFFHPTSKFPHVPLGIGGWRLGYEERRCWAKTLYVAYSVVYSYKIMSTKAISTA